MQQAFPSPSSTTTSGSNSQPPPPNNNPSPTPTPTPTPITSGSNSQPPPPPNSSLNPTKTRTNFRNVVAENAVIVFGLRGCCMCHVVKCLLLGIGVNPPVVEVDEHEEAAVIDELSAIGLGGEGDGGQGLMFPAVFVRGKLFGGLEKVMATHISGFRFQPTDEELIIHYMKRKVSQPYSPLVSIIADIDLYKFNPWELPAKAMFGDSEWFFFTPRDRKYPNGARPNRTAGCGYWKATGTDKPILNSGGLQCIGVKKALVFYEGRPPKGLKTDWVMHEYRLLDDSSHSLPRLRGSMKLDDWVLCRVREKNHPPQQIQEYSEESSFSSITGLNFTNRVNSIDSVNEVKAAYVESPRDSAEVDQQQQQQQLLGFFNFQGGPSKPITRERNISHSNTKDGSRTLKRSVSVVSFGEEFPMSKRIQTDPFEYMEDTSIFQVCYLC